MSLNFSGAVLVPYGDLGSPVVLFSALPDERAVPSDPVCLSLFSWSAVPLAVFVVDGRCGIGGGGTGSVPPSVRLLSVSCLIPVEVSLSLSGSSSVCPTFQSYHSSKEYLSYISGSASYSRR